MRSYVINLSRSPDRLAHMKAQLERSGIGYEIVTPDDGLDLGLDDPETAAILEDGVTLPDDLAALLDTLSGHLSGAEVALLNFDSAQPCKVSREGSVDLPSTRQLVVPVEVSQRMSAAAYIITMDACTVRGYSTGSAAWYPWRSPRRHISRRQSPTTQNTVSRRVPSS